jgi:hypothetical protein
VMQLSLRKEAIRDSTLIEDLDRARVQTAGTRSGKILAGAPLDDTDIDARQRQLRRQHQTCRASSGNHYRMFTHSAPVAIGCLLQTTMMRHDAGLAASPRARYILEVGGEINLLFAFPMWIPLLTDMSLSYPPAATPK